MTPAILTIAYVIAVCAIVGLGHCHELAIHAADQRECHGQPDEPRRGGEVDIRKIHDPLIIEGAQRNHV